MPLPKLKNETESEKELKKKHIWIMVCAILVILFCGSAFTVYMIVHSFRYASDGASREIKSLSVDLSHNEKNAGDIAADGSDNLVRRYLDGVFVASGTEDLLPVAVMIDNSVFARPPSALAKAGLVYEAEVEGDATRLMAVFSSDENLSEIGPVRSARPYFLEWSREFGAPYVHCGGSPEALAILAKGDIVDINEFYNGGYFWRDDEREAPHNLYTSSRLLDKYLTNIDADKKEFSSWLFKEDMEEKERPEASRITIGYKLPDYVVTWKYDRLSDSYLRYAGGRAHIDRNGDGIVAKDVIVQYVDTRVIDAMLRLRMDIIGDGRATVCLDGACRDGEWRKEASGERTRFYYEDGGEVQFNAGPIWIEVVRPGYEVNYE